MNNFIQSIVKEHKKLLDFESISALIPQVEKILAEMGIKSELTIFGDRVRWKIPPIRWDIGDSHYCVEVFCYLGEPDSERENQEELPLPLKAVVSAFNDLVGGIIIQFDNNLEEDPGYTIFLQSEKTIGNYCLVFGTSEYIR